MSYLDDIKDIPVPADAGDYDGPPRMYWHNGNRQAGTGGSFYLKAAELGGVDQEPGKPWQACERFQGEQGYSTETLRIAVLGYRAQAFKEDGDRRVWLAEWTEGARFQTELLCLVQGLEAWAPVVWVAKGLTGKAMTAKGTGVLAQYREALLKPASQEAGRALPLWTFWLPITTLKKDGAVVYSDTGFKSVVTPPMIHPQALDASKAEKLFVGADLYRLGADIRVEYDGWLRQRRGGVEATEQASDELFDDPSGPRPAAQSKRAVIDEESLPF
jgi:hypothetical protein